MGPFLSLSINFFGEIKMAASQPYASVCIVKRVTVSMYPAGSIH